MTSLTKDEKISKLDTLIGEGKSLFVTKSFENHNISYDPFDERGPSVEYYSDVNHDAYPGWRVKSIVTLKNFFGENSTYVKEFEENCKAISTEQNLRQGIGVLEAAKKGYEDGLAADEELSMPEVADVINTQSILRRLFNELASSLSSTMTFNNIAKVFFESGVIDTPEKPYGVYQGSKSDYALEKLLNAQNKSGFPEMLSSVQFELCYSADGPLVNDELFVRLMELLGYKRNQDDPDPALIAPKKLPQDNVDKVVHKRVVIGNLPSNISELIDELNDNIERKNVNACALLIRKILTLSCFIVLDKIGKSILLDNKELNDALSIVQQELKISQTIMAKVKSSKWIGDSANHSYKIKINESDVEVAITGLRIFLEEVF